MDGAAYSYSKIIKRPLQKLRRAVASRFLHRGLNINAFLDLASAIQEFVDAHHPEYSGAFKSELNVALSTLENGKPERQPELEHPAFQLLWASVMATALSDPKVIEKWDQEARGEGFDDTPLWEAITKSPYMTRELSETTLDLANAVKRPQVKVGWGVPPSGYPNVAYFYSLEHDYINLDPVWGMIFGIEHARGATMHEIAHGQGSLAFTQKIQALHDQMEEMKARQDDWKDDDYFKFAKLYAEWKTRFLIWDEAENNYANRFAANRGSYSAQDYGRSLNFVESVLSDTILAASPTVAEGDIEKKMDVTTPDVMKRVMNLKKALRYVFYKNNDFLPDTEVGWAEIGLDLDLLVESIPGATERGMTARQILDEIIPLCEEIEHSQPEPHERMYGAKYFYDRVKECSENRNRIIDDIFERFFDPFLPEIMQQVDEQTEQILKIIRELKQALQDGKNSIYIEGLGEISICEAPPKDPREIKGKAKDCKGGQCRPGEQSKKAAPSNAKSPSPSQSGKSCSGAGGIAEPVVNEQGSQSQDYPSVIAPHYLTIRKISRLLRDMRDRVIKLDDDRIPKHTIFPEDGDFSRFDPDRMRERLIKQFSGQNLDEDDFYKFQRDLPVKKDHPPAELIVLVDGSGSMQGEPLQTAVLVGCILVEATKGLDIDVYVDVFGSAKPIHVIQPRDNNEKLANAFNRARAINTGGTYLGPSLLKSVAYTTEQRPDSKGMVGNTHVFVVTDGYFSDGNELYENIRKLSGNCPHHTLDFILIDAHAQFPHAQYPPLILKISDEINRKLGKERIGYKSIKRVEHIEKALLSLLQTRIHVLAEADAIMFQEKQLEFKAVTLI